MNHAIKNIVKKFSMTLMSGLLFVCTLQAQSTEEAKNNAEKIKLMLGGSFAKPKILPGLEKFALAQVKINFKMSTTESTIGKERSTGAISGDKLAAYL